MQVVILAAGRGLRFGAKDVPKALLQLENGKTILEMQVAQLEPHCSLQDICVLVGYQQALIRRAFPQITYVENPSFATENTAKSLLRAIEGAPVDGDLLWLNGDVVFHPKVLQSLLSQQYSAMVVNRATVGEEEVKYRTDGRGRILEVSKQVCDGEGEALGINYFTARDLPRLKQELANCAPMDYFEAAVEQCIRQGTDVRAIEIAMSDCVEIDFPADLSVANQSLRFWS